MFHTTFNIISFHSYFILFMDTTSLTLIPRVERSWLEEKATILLLLMPATPYMPCCSAQNESIQSYPAGIACETLQISYSARALEWQSIRNVLAYTHMLCCNTLLVKYGLGYMWGLKWAYHSLFCINGALLEILLPGGLVLTFLKENGVWLLLVFPFSIEDRKALVIKTWRITETQTVRGK